MTVPLDFFVQSYKDSVEEPILDFMITGDGQLFSLFNEPAIKQRALVASFTQKGSVPQLPTTGVEWAELLTGQVTPANINSEVFNAIHECADTYGYLPQYMSIGDQLIVTIKEQA